MLLAAVWVGFACGLRVSLEQHHCRRGAKVAGSLLELPLDAVAAAAGEPPVQEVLQDERWLHAPAPSRLPQRT